MTLHLKQDCLDYLEEWDIRRLIKKYSDFVEHPIVMDVEKEVEDEKDKKKKNKKTVEEMLNSRKAIWLKSKNEVKEEEYNEFYKHLSRDMDDPLKVIHYSAEGRREFKALLYLAKRRPFDLFNQDIKGGLQLYVRRVFIMDNCEKLAPEYMRFVKGVVDSSDLPLNVSREILQQDKQLDQIRKSLVNKVLTTLKEMKEKEYEKYLEFYKQFGVMIKEGVHSDFENREALQDLLLYESSKTKPGDFLALKDYVRAMPSGQKEIYYLVGENRVRLEKSPHLEFFNKKGFEVLFMTESVDEWVMNGMMEYDKKKFKAVDRGDIAVDDGDLEKEIKKKEKEHKDFLEQIKARLADVKEVRFSTRLTDSACCLVADESAMGTHMERLMRHLNQEIPKQEHILELNPHHELVESLIRLYQKDQNHEKLGEYAGLLYDQALLVQGAKIADPLLFAKRLNGLMARECGGIV